MRRTLIAAITLLSMTLLPSCAHKPKERSFPAKATEKTALKAAACALRAEGYDTDLEVDKEMGSVSGRRFADGGLVDAESVRATFEVVPEKRKMQEVYITYKPGRGVISSSGEQREKMRDLEDSFDDCLRRRR